jgi:hypothetical protein
VLHPAVRRAEARIRSRQPYLCQELVAGERRDECALEEAVDRDRPFAAAGAGDELGVEGEKACRQVGCRVGVGNGAADRADVPDLDVADRRYGVLEHAVVHRRRLHELGVRRERADRDPAVGELANAAQLGQATDVDELGRLGQPEPHQRQDALAAGDDLRRAARAGQVPDRLLDGARADVVEFGGDHARAPFADCMARHTLRAESGMSMWWIPRGDSASTTAFTTAGVDAIVPASPMPLTPSGLTGEGVTVWSSSNAGKPVARGTA